MSLKIWELKKNECGIDYRITVKRQASKENHNVKNHTLSFFPNKGGKLWEKKKPNMNALFFFNCNQHADCWIPLCPFCSHFSWIYFREDPALPSLACVQLRAVV